MSEYMYMCSIHFSVQQKHNIINQLYAPIKVNKKKGISFKIQQKRVREKQGYENKQ